MTNSPTDIPIGELLKHAPPMILIDRVLECADEHLTAEVVIRDDSPFCIAGAVGAWVGIEYMAQAIAAWSGWRARERGEPIRIGFLLGTRRYESQVGHFPVGSRLEVQVAREFQADNGLARFKAELLCGGVSWATASVSVYEPPATHPTAMGQP
jgi:predicted hotdog family 3-hydroxylacyl-ACP dehydratase